MCAICNGMTLEEFRRQTLARIADQDYTTIGVDPERQHGRIVVPGFAYSIGLWAFRRVPEVVVVGAPYLRAIDMIQAYAELTAAGRSCRPGEPPEELVPGYRCTFAPVARGHDPDWFARAFDLYPDGGFPAVQILWYLDKTDFMDKVER